MVIFAFIIEGTLIPVPEVVELIFIVPPSILDSELVDHIPLEALIV